MSLRRMPEIRQGRRKNRRKRLLQKRRTSPKQKSRVAVWKKNGRHFIKMWRMSIIRMPYSFCCKRHSGFRARQADDHGSGCRFFAGRSGTDRRGDRSHQPLPGMLWKESRIIPDFESTELYLLGSISLKGIVFLWHFVYLIVSVYFNKDCKKLFHL